MMMMESKVYDIKIEDYNYPLPDERIAKHPIAQRDMCKLLFYREGEISEHVFRDVPSLLPENSTLVYNNTKVINARLRFRKPGGGALIEIFCLEPLSPLRNVANGYALWAIPRSGSRARCRLSLRQKDGILLLWQSAADRVAMLSA